MKTNFYLVNLLRTRNYLAALITLLLYSFSLSAQNDCEITKDQGNGYSTGIKSVTDNKDGTYTIELSVKHAGCTEGCNSMSRYSVEALPGTYSNVFITLVEGNFNYKNIDLGPRLSGDPFDGFRLTGTSDFGGGDPAEFIITYTLSGGLQNQRTQVKQGNNYLIVGFSISDFESVLNCNNVNIFPYYTPPEGGKLVSIISPELNSLYNFYRDGGKMETNDIFQIYGDSVLVEVFVQDGMYAAALSLLQTSYGLSDVKEDASQEIFSGKIPILNLFSLNSLETYLKAVRPVYPAIPAAGIVTSLGDKSMRSDFARNGFNLEGEGVKIGVISDSYNTITGNPAADDILRGDLPGPGNSDNPNPVEVVFDYPFGTQTDEGRAMLQIVHDIAPKATLAFRTGYVSASDFAQGIIELKNIGCDIIVDDITYITQPFLADGIVAQAVDQVKAEGVKYFSAAGNYGNKSYEGLFVAGSSPNGLAGVAHDFSGNGGNDIYQSITVAEGNYTIVLQWEDGSGQIATNTDLDIYLTTDNGNTLFGFNRDNIGNQPIEILPFTVGSGGAQTNIMINKAAGSSDVYLKYIVFRGNLTFDEYATGASTLVGQSNAEGAIAVGAVLYSNTPEFGVTPPTIASFSSIGGTPVNGIIRNKPDITAPNGVNTTVNLGGVNIDDDAFPNFFGTSASAPHAAGVAALLVEAKSKYYNSGISPDEMKSILQSTAIDMDTTGFDYVSGAGFIQADAALLSLANPSPYVSGLSYDTLLIPGYEPVEVTISGSYFTPESEIYFNGEPLQSGTTVQGDSILIATIPEFTDLFPVIQAYNPPNAQTNGTDGGLSDPLYFSTKDKILVEIDDKTKKYGEVLPEFTANYSFVSTNDSVSLESSGLSAEEIDRIKAIAFTTIATDLSNVGLWEIYASTSDPLNPESGIQATDSFDIDLLNHYDFIFKSGLLTIEKMDLLVQAQDTTFTYGEELSGFQFNYIFNNDTTDPANNVVIDPAISAAMELQLQQTHAAALVNAVALVNAAALANELGESQLNVAALANKSFMISDATAWANAIAIANGTYIDPQALLDATALANTAPLVNTVALVNARALVNGIAYVNTAPLVNSLALANAAAYVNSTTINAESNSDAIVILSEDDIAILDGTTSGSVDLKSINLVTGKTVGDHLIVPGSLVSGNFNVSYGLGKLTIIAAHAGISVLQNEVEKTYDGQATAPTVQTVPDSLPVILEFDGSETVPVNVGTYELVVSIDDPNYIGSDTVVYTIHKAPLSIIADSKVIDEGDSLPELSASFEGFVNGEDESVLENFSLTVQPEYTGLAGVYNIIPSAGAANYDISITPGSLYVNAFGPGARNVKTQLLCIEDLRNDPDGYLYVANFEYENPNSTPIYLEIGDENYVEGLGSFDASDQPIEFLPGTGTWQVRFDGQKITWVVISNNGNHKTSAASDASSSSSKCKKGNSTKSAQILSDNGLESEGLEITNVYPNPTRDKVFVAFNGRFLNQKNISVFDLSGRMIKVEMNNMESTVQINLSGLDNGIYIIRIKQDEADESFRIIKQ